jgi:quercetin dioxygenase-like cupin family protein
VAGQESSAALGVEEEEGVNEITPPGAFAPTYGGVTMNTRTFAMLFYVGAFICTSAFAQDAVKVAPNLFKVLAENDKVRVLEVDAKKGDKAAMHSHPAMVIYILEGGKTKFTNADGTVRESAAKTGDVLLRDPVTHSQEHVEASRAIVVELKK